MDSFQICFETMCKDPSKKTKCTILEAYNKDCVSAGFNPISTKDVCDDEPIVLEPTFTAVFSEIPSIIPTVETKKSEVAKPTDRSRSTDKRKSEPTTEVKPTNKKPTKPTEVKPTEVKPTEVKPTEVKPTDKTKSAEVIPTKAVEDINQCSTNSTLQAGVFLYCQLTIFGIGANKDCNVVSVGWG